MDTIIVSQIVFEIFDIKRIFHNSNDNKSSPVAEMGDHGHNRHGPKKGDVSLLWGELGPHLTQRRLGQSLPP